MVGGDDSSGVDGVEEAREERKEMIKGGRRGRYERKRKWDEKKNRRES